MWVAWPTRKQASSWPLGGRNKTMRLSLVFSKLTPTLFIYYGAVLLPYLTVGLGLYLGHSAWLAMGGYHLGMLILLYALHRPIQPFKFHWTMSVSLLVGVTFLGSLLAGVLVFLLWPWLMKLPTATFASLLATWDLTPSRWYGFVGYFCLVNPWLEELYWRGLLNSASGRTWETAGWFAGYHGLVLIPLLQWEWIVLILVILTITGWWYYQLMKLGRGLFGPILCHLAADVSIILALNRLYPT